MGVALSFMVYLNTSQLIAGSCLLELTSQAGTSLYHLLIKGGKL